MKTSEEEQRLWKSNPWCLFLFRKRIFFSNNSQRNSAHLHADIRTSTPSLSALTTSYQRGNERSVLTCFICQFASVIPPLRQSHHAGTNSRYADFLFPPVIVHYYIHTLCLPPATQVSFRKQVFSICVIVLHLQMCTCLDLFHLFALLCSLETPLNIYSLPQRHFASCCCISRCGRCLLFFFLRGFHCTLLRVMSIWVSSLHQCVWVSL